MPHKGACLCGQTTIELASTHNEQVTRSHPLPGVFHSDQCQTICHCTDCRQTSGSAFSINVLAQKKDVTIKGPVKEYDIKAASGNPGTRVFCGNCGSAISQLSAAFGDAQVIQTGNFNDFARVPITTELFVKDRWSGLVPIVGAAQMRAME
ncbi:Mss4-like protein [Mycena amicta]|nr:Mss4-like protein [Mycena amicta]